MTTNAATEYRQQAREFLAKALQYLADGDLHQASEKGPFRSGRCFIPHGEGCLPMPWVILTSAMSEFRRSVVARAGRTLGHRRLIVRLAHSAEILHSNYYQRQRRFLMRTTSPMIWEMSPNCWTAWNPSPFASPSHYGRIMRP